jgi:hypothetical protein
MKRIWFKPDCLTWIAEGKKTTTFRKTKHSGEYFVVQGSWYKPKPTGLTVALKPLFYTCKDTVVKMEFDREGDFKTSDEFLLWLEKNKLKLPEWGWVHEVKVKLRA